MAVSRVQERAEILRSHSRPRALHQQTSHLNNMESQDVTVDVPTNEEATQSSENQPKSEPSKGMLKSSSTAARFQVAPVSAGNEP